MVAIADIKIAVRSQKTAKTTGIYETCDGTMQVAECGTVWQRRQCSGMEAIVDYLAGTAYAGGAARLLQNPSSAFETLVRQPYDAALCSPRNMNPFP